MFGHVNMMDDVLISHLSKDILQSSIRALISQGSFDARGILIQHVQERFKQSPPPLPPASDLFPSHGVAESAAERFLSSTSCLFTCKMIPNSLENLIYFVRAIVSEEVRWQSDDTCAKLLHKADGDIVQAVQALKETQPELTELRTLLADLRTGLSDCKAYCAANALHFPFTRAMHQVDDLLCADPFLPISSKMVLNIDPMAQIKWDYYKLGPLYVPRLFNGFWQLSSTAWGITSIDKQKADLKQLIESGLVAADMADHYGDAELTYGEFRTDLDTRIASNVIAATKWCVFAPLNKAISKDLVLDAVKMRSRRLGGGRVDLLQFHWQDYSDKRYLQILAELVSLTGSHPDLVAAIGLCNFDADHTREVCEYLRVHTGKVGIVSNQIQYSLIDCRPIFKMEAICREYDIKLLTYGTLCGGFLSEKYLDVKIPDIYSETQPLTPSQRKYFDMISTWGSWSDFQQLLRNLKSIAEKHGVDIANVATRWVLDRDGVGSVLVGTRLGLSINVKSNMKTFTFRLTDEDRRQIDEVVLGKKAQALFESIGDCGQEYRGKVTA